MTERKDDATLLRPAETVDGALYETLGRTLQTILTLKFGLPLEVAESLVDETFATYYTEDDRPSDANAWLIGAACRSAKTYLQRRGLALTDAPDDAREVENLLFHREALELLPERARQALSLRFRERRTYDEIAAEFDVAPYYAKQLVAKAVAKLRKVIRETREG
jgi:RNA polymerase sigma factor (sigma-70 family)